MNKVCSPSEGCLWSENSKFCEMLYNASVPLDNKWPLLILYLRGIGGDTFLSESQKGKMQDILVRTLQGKKFTQDEYDKIVTEINDISQAPYRQKIEEITSEVKNLTEEANRVLGRHQKNIISVADSVDSDIQSGASPSAVLSGLRDALRDMAEKMEKDTMTLLTLSHKDSLTGLANRRAFDEFLDKAVEAWLSQSTSVSLIFFDVDNFKNFNDTYGHLVGDQVLKTLAARVRQVVTPLEDAASQAHAARYGGEEFAIILCGPVASQAVFIAETVRKSIKESSLLLRDMDGNVVQSGLQVTVSLGIAALWNGWTGAYQSNLLDAADKALYKAKRSGKNCSAQYLPESKEEYKVVTSE